MSAERKLFGAVHHNDLYMLQEALMEHPELDVNNQVVDGMTALHFAAEKGYASCVKILISSGADVNIRDDFGYTSLMVSVRAGWPLVVRRLLDAGCGCDITTTEGVCALHMACTVDSVGLVQMMLAAGAKPSLRNRIGDTPLIAALKTGHENTVQAILFGVHYINPNEDAKSNVYSTPLWEALDLQYYTAAKALLLTGYCGILEAKRYFSAQKASLSSNIVRHRNTGVERTLAPYEVSRRLDVMNLASEPLSLQHMCRLSIRKFLNFNIHELVCHTQLPTRLQEYVCFKDVYQAPDLNAEHAVYSFFADHSELY